MTMQPSAPEGTALGANTTSGAAGIALGNRVVMRGFVDFVYNYDTKSNPEKNPVTNKTEDGKDVSDFNTASDIDFLFDFSPVTAEVHLAMDPNPAAGSDQIELEQAFARYSFNRDFHITFGRQLTSLGFEDDEAPGLYTVTNSYQLSNKLKPVNVHQGYNDGIRANFNNGRFGFILGLYDGYWKNNNFNEDKVGIDVGASLMIVPGLEYRIGYAHNGTDNNGVNDNITQFNTWLSYNPGALTLAIEYDKYDAEGRDISDIMLLANYQFSDLIAASIRYVYEDVEDEMAKNHLLGGDSDRISLALLFSITQNFGLNFEYSHWAINAEKDYSINQFYVEGLITF